MESYVPLLKAIIISTMFTWGTTSVMITDDYILKEVNYVDWDSGLEEKEYQIYNKKNNVIQLFDQDLKRINTSNVDQYEKFKIQGSRSPQDRVVKTTIEKYDFGGYKCKKEAIEIEERGLINQMGSYKNTANLYSEISYFAKIPWLDKYLDTKVKRKFAGFERQEYSPYHYLIHENVQYPNMTPQDNVLLTIEKSEVDTTFIHTLLSLPLSVN